MRRQPLIIGGGPAGAAAAITLARAGCPPLLVESATGPADKVCGDFLSIDAIERARALCVDPAALGAVPIRHVRLIHHRQVTEASLPFPALGLSRRRLDAALLQAAEHSGAVLMAGHTVRHLTRDAAGWHARTDAATLDAGVVFLATGKHDLRAMPRRSGKAGSHANASANAGSVGMKMYLRLAPGAARSLQGATELTVFPGGYAGMQFVEQDRAVVCVAVRRQALRTCGGNWSGLLAAIGRASPRFAAQLAGATPLLARPLAVAGIPYGYQAQPRDVPGLFRLGDQAAVIASLTGDGMAIALHSGRAAALAWLAGTDAASFQATLARQLAGQMRLAGLLHRAGISFLSQGMAVQLASLFPGLLRQAATRTRLRLPGPQPRPGPSDLLS